MSIEIPDFDDVNVLVVGDVMLDRYWFGEASRVSPEAPVPVVRINDTDNRPGGAANVALNLACLGAGVRLVGSAGSDEAGAILVARLHEANVVGDIHVDVLGWEGDHPVGVGFPKTGPQRRSIVGGRQAQDL